jgi:hypothetical protein
MAFELSKPKHKGLTLVSIGNVPMPKRLTGRTDNGVDSKIPRSYTR